MSKVLEELKENPTLLELGPDALKEKLNIDDDELVKAIYENKESLEQLSTDIQESEDLRKAASRQATLDIIENNEALSNSNYKDEMVEALAGVYSNT
jgi:hypothetical protein